MSQSNGHMQAEIKQAPTVFSNTVKSTVKNVPANIRAFYTIARGSSDAAANILSYEFMAQLGRPMTSLPPSVFSLGSGVDLAGSAVVVISQSGASDDLVRAAKGAREKGAYVIALTNQPGSPVENAADMTVPINAGPERAIPATKTVIGSIAAGMALLGGLKHGYATSCQNAAVVFATVGTNQPFPWSDQISATLAQSENVYVIGRGAGFGAAQEVALKLKETCALHAEAYSASEVLHGPLQLVTKPLTVLFLDTGEAITQDSMNTAEKRFRTAGAQVYRIDISALTTADLVPAAVAAILLFICYGIILSTARILQMDPDSPNQLAKITRTV